MLNKILALLLFIGAPCVAYAQQLRLLKNKHITWAAEIDVIYSLKPPPAPDPLWDNEIAVWKSYDPKSAIQYDGGELLIRKILDAARSGAWPVWQLNDPAKQIDFTAVSDSLVWWIDTIITFDVVTFEERVKIIKNELEPSGFTAIRAKQLLYFDDKKGEFGLATIAIAPVFTYTWKVPPKYWGAEERDTILYEQTPFWLKMPDIPAKSYRKFPKVNATNITWAAQIRTLGNSPEPNLLNPVKNTKAPVMQALLDRFRQDRRYKATDFYSYPLPFDTRAALFISNDTLARINWEDYTETIEINHNELRAEHVVQLRLVQNWYWDDRKQRLIIRLERFAPIVDGDLWKWPSRPLFYRRIK